MSLAPLRLGLEGGELPEPFPGLLPHDGLVGARHAGVGGVDHEPVVGPRDDLGLAADDADEGEGGPGLAVVLVHRELAQPLHVRVARVRDRGPAAHEGPANRRGRGGRGGDKEEEQGEGEKRSVRRRHGW